MTDIHTQTLRLPNELRQAVDRYWHERMLPSRHAAILCLLMEALRQPEAGRAALAEAEEDHG